MIVTLRLMADEALELGQLLLDVTNQRKPNDGPVSFDWGDDDGEIVITIEGEISNAQDSI